MGRGVLTRLPFNPQPALTLLCSDALGLTVTSLSPEVSESPQPHSTCGLRAVTKDKSPSLSEEVLAVVLWTASTEQVGKSTGRT